MSKRIEAAKDSTPPRPRCWRTIKFMAGRFDKAFSEAAIRALVHRSRPHFDSKGDWVKGNGLAPYITQPGGKGGKVLIDEIGWDHWLESWTGEPATSERSVA